MLMAIILTAIFLPVTIFFAVDIYETDRKKNKFEWWMSTYLFFVWTMILVILWLSVFFPSLNNNP